MLACWSVESGRAAAPPYLPRDGGAPARVLSREPRTQRARRRGAHAEREACRECVGVAAHRGGYAGRPSPTLCRRQRSKEHVARDCGRPGFGWNLHGKTACSARCLTVKLAGGTSVRA